MRQGGKDENKLAGRNTWTTHWHGFGVAVDWLGRVGGAVLKQIKVTMLPDNDIPAFAGYLSGSVRDPSAEIVINFEAMVNSAADHTNAPLTFEEIFTTSVAHELMHVIQDFYRKNFDEEEVERVIEEAAKMFYGDGE